MNKNPILPKRGQRAAKAAKAASKKLKKKSKKKTMLALLLVPCLSFAGETYIHVSGSLGSVIGGKGSPNDGNLPFWGAAGLTWEADDSFEMKFEAFHRSNADKDGVEAKGSEYELNGLRVGIEYKFKIGG
jgi:hypothetical protein